MNNDPCNATTFHNGTFKNSTETTGQYNNRKATKQTEVTFKHSSIVAYYQAMKPLSLWPN